MRQNYQPWHIDFTEFDRQQSPVDQLRFLLRFAVLAPSSHNSQPWQFAIRSEDVVTIQADLTRSLPASDANHRQLFISVGCALENLLAAADYYGFQPLVDIAAGIERNPLITVRFRKTGITSPDPSHPALCIPRRHTNRNRYAERLPEEAFLRWISSLSDNEVHLRLVQAREERHAIADIIVNATLAAMDDLHFRRELSAYLKSNLTASKIGMPGFGFGIPTPLSFFAANIMRHFNINKLTRRHDEELLKEFTPLFVVISSREDNPANWIKSGQLFERIALEGERRDVKTAPLAAAIQIGDYFQDLRRILGEPYRPQVFFRMGYCDKSTLPSPRLSAEECLGQDLRALV